MRFSRQIVIAKMAHYTFQIKDEHTFPTGCFPQNSPKSNVFCSSWDNSNSAEVLPEGSSFLLPWDMQYHFVALRDSKPNLYFPRTALFSNTYLWLNKEFSLQGNVSTACLGFWVSRVINCHLTVFKILTDLLNFHRSFNQ